MKKLAKILTWVLVLASVLVLAIFVTNLFFYNTHYKDSSVEQKTERCYYNIKNILTKNPELLSQITVTVNKNKGDRDDTITNSETSKLWDDDNYYMYIKIPYHELDGHTTKDADDFFRSYRHTCGYDCKYYIQIEYIKGRSIRSSVVKDVVITGFSNEDLIMSSHEICDLNGNKIFMDKISSMESTKKGQTTLLNLLPNLKIIALKIKPTMWE